MKKLLFSVISMCAAVVCSAQLLTVDSPVKVATGDLLPCKAVLSPDGTKVLVDDNVKAGLSIIDLATSEVKQVSPTGYSYEMRFTGDGNQVAFRENTMKGHLRYQSAKTVDLTTGATKELVAPTRDLNALSVEGNNVVAVEKGKLKGVKTTTMPVVSINRGALYITVNGKTTNLSPNGVQGESYLWPSVSPDGKHIVYYRAAYGCYVCDIDGKNPVRIGTIRAPQWIDNSTIIGMVDNYTGSESYLIASNLDGSLKQRLTDDSVVAMYPSVAAGR
ncbi:MAG: PD40 domain-containing protein, partial [Salinivirgaceae bacterium]|nr:PD40 domain-containing protein [Salinivirgaceae bacterium]